MHCEICGNNRDSRRHWVKEMMFGTREVFEYLECGQCGCLQLVNKPEDMSRYYPAEYYSLRGLATTNYDIPRLTGWGGIKSRYFNRGNQTTRYYFNRTYLLGWLLERYCRFGPPTDLSWLATKVDLRLKRTSRILDAGSGFGKRLLGLRAVGFVNLIGVDAFIPDDIAYDCGVKIIKMAIEDASFEEPFDFIMLNHSLEHMTDQLRVIQKLSALLKPDGTILIRIPLAGTLAWREFGVNWVQLDAPRHFYLHTMESFGVLAQKAGLRIVDVVFDSTGFQLWGSELYRMDISLTDTRSPWVNPEQTIFREEQLADFEQRAVQLNKTNDGDQACFVLKV